jgi:hypothetical protein
MIPEHERLKLLKQRERLEDEINTLRAKPLGLSQASKAFRQEDLTKLAHKIILIDKRLGRNPM